VRSRLARSWENIELRIKGTITPSILSEFYSRTDRDVSSNLEHHLDGL
jgi:hypothetical protein